MFYLYVAKETRRHNDKAANPHCFSYFLTVLYCFSEVLQRRVPRAWPNIVLFIRSRYHIYTSDL
jgi:hypothetical protein